MADGVIASAPGKLMLFGEHAVVYDYPCIVTAVDQRMMVEVKLRKDKRLVIRTNQPGMSRYERQVDELGQGIIPKQAKFSEMLVSNFYSKFKVENGLEIRTDCQFSSKFGFGSSAAVTAALAMGLYELFSIKASKPELFDLCYKTVLDVQGVGSGFDVASAIWGGTIYYIKGGKKIEAINCGDYPLVVGYTGIKADTPTLIKQVAKLKKRNSEKVSKIFTEIKKITEKARTALEERDDKELGGLMSLNQLLLDELGVSSNRLDELISASCKNGAWGAKLSGAGGGDCMIALAGEEKKKKVENGIRMKQGEVLKVKHCAEGVRLEKRK